MPDRAQALGRNVVRPHETSRDHPRGGDPGPHSRLPQCRAVMWRGRRFAFSWRFLTGWDAVRLSETLRISLFCTLAYIATNHSANRRRFAFLTDTPVCPLLVMERLQ